MKNQQLNLFFQLLYKSYYIFRPNFFHRLKMACYWVLLSTFVTKMFLPSMGLHDFAPFILISSVISYGLFVCMQNAMNLVDDITGDQAILYQLSLPIPSWVIFFQFAVSNMIEGLIISLAIIPFGLLVLMDPYPFAQFSLLKCTVIFICANIFYGCFSLILATFLKNMSQVDNVWLRVIFPIWYLGCYQFPWQALYKISPLCAYLDLLNPMTFILEAGRSATINSTGSLPFWPCCGIILIFAALSCKLGIYWMKKRLDCI